MANPQANPIAYTETTADPGSQFGAGPITITSVTTSNGVTTVDATVQANGTSYDATGTVLGNDTSDILLYANIQGQSGDLFLTNSPSGQPGVGNTANVANESANVTYQPVCFASGTRLRTPRGDVAVEVLGVGDLVVTSSGDARPIRWLGHRTIGGGAKPCPAEAQPIRIAAHAFGPSRPARDLVVSPGHAICVEVIGETLVPASALVNGTTIVRETVETVTYWHVELDSHDVLLAENMPAESYLDVGNRGFFVESGVVAIVAGPDVPVRGHLDVCRPYAASGPVVDVVRARLAARADAGGQSIEARPRDARAA